LTDGTDPKKLLYKPVTSGAAVDRKYSDTHGWSVLVLCPKCSHEKIIDKPSLKTVEYRYPPWIEIAEDIEDL
jgi:hypothetical protein